MSKVFLTPNLSVTKRETECGPIYELWINGRFNYELGRPKGKYEE